MSSKKKRYNCRFPPARIKKIMQTDEEVGKVAAVVPVIISKALELFVGSLLKESRKITLARNARTLTPSHLKACIYSNKELQFLREFVAMLPDIAPTSDDDEHLELNQQQFNANEYMTASNNNTTTSTASSFSHQPPTSVSSTSAYNSAHLNSGVLKSNRLNSSSSTSSSPSLTKRLRRILPKPTNNDADDDDCGDDDDDDDSQEDECDEDDDQFDINTTTNNNSNGSNNNENTTQLKSTPNLSIVNQFNTNQINSFGLSLSAAPPEDDDYDA